MSERIRLLRQHLGLSQTEFAKKMGMTRSMISNLELGLIEIPDYKLEMICKVFNVRIHWLRTGEGEMFNPAAASLDAMADANSIDPVTRAIVEGLIEMPTPQREAFIDLIFDISDRIRNSDYDAAKPEAVAAAASKYFKDFSAARTAGSPQEEDHPDQEPHTV